MKCNRILSKQKQKRKRSERQGRVLTQHSWVCPFAEKRNTRTTYWKEKKERKLPELFHCS